ncbi:MAG: neutral/alkaline non-lysosomal ceramidase N-terminal domain-containing protein [Planctomycetaceae bacterium]|nr:neutral/alkaline non-lysosomal ceramidase N-terminal domain-containing protein [Planctomycetaceae bacterium]
MSSTGILPVFLRGMGVSPMLLCGTGVSPVHQGLHGRDAYATQRLRRRLLKAGTGRCDITPREVMFLVGYPHVQRVSTGIADPLHATALCLDDGATAIISVSADVLYVSADLVGHCRRRIAARTGVRGENVLISATHTHSAPVTCEVLAWRDDPVVPPPDERYLALLADGIVSAACVAFEHSAPAELAITSAMIDGVGSNRLSPDGPRDPQAGLIVVRRLSDKQIVAVQMFYSMHPTVLHEDSTLVSADFPGYARAFIESRCGGRVVYHTGPCGNLSPRYHVKAQTLAEAQRLGSRLGEQACSAIDALGDANFRSDITLAAASGTAQLPCRTFPAPGDAAAHLAAAREGYQRLVRDGAPRAAVRTAECSVFGAEELLTLAKAQADGTLAAVQQSHAQAAVQVFRIGEAYVAALPGECFVEYALEIKRGAGGHVFVTSLANGHLQGYITTPDAQGYEADLSLFEPSAGALLVETTLDLITNMESGANDPGD